MSSQETIEQKVNKIISLALQINPPARINCDQKYTVQVTYCGSASRLVVLVDNNENERDKYLAIIYCDMEDGVKKLDEAINRLENVKCKV